MTTYNTLDPTSNTESDDTYLLMQNGINRLQTKGILSAALDQGQWQNSFDYRINDITRGTDGKRYIALESSGPNAANGVIDPVTGVESVWFDCTDTLKGEGTASFSDNSDKLDGQHGGFYRDASNLNAGTVPTARLPEATATSKGVSRQATAQEVDDKVDVDAYVPPDLLAPKATTSQAQAGTDDKAYMTASTTSDVTLGSRKQSIKDYSASRQSGVFYPNNSGAPMLVSVGAGSAASSGMILTVKDRSGVNHVVASTTQVNGPDGFVCYVVPDGYEYQISGMQGENYEFWTELSL